MMKISFLLRASALLTLIVIPVAEVCAQDSEPPVLEAVRVSPAVVDVTDGPVDIALEFDITDNLSGYNQGSLRIRFEETTYFTGLPSASIVEGTPLGGTYRVIFTMPAGSPPGLRRLRVLLSDNAGQDALYEPATTFEVVNRGAFDQEKPQIVAIAIEPKTVDLTDGPRKVAFEITVADDFSGVTGLWAFIEPVNPVVFVNDPRSWRFFAITEGNEVGVVRFETTMGRYTQGGEWRLRIENMGDGVLRAGAYNDDAEKLAADFNSAIRAFKAANP